MTDSKGGMIRTNHRETRGVRIRHGERKRGLKGAVVFRQVAHYPNREIMLIGAGTWKEDLAGIHR